MEDFIALALAKVFMVRLDILDTKLDSVTERSCCCADLNFVLLLVLLSSLDAVHRTACLAF
jgi:hypothetical protein